MTGSRVSALLRNLATFVGGVAFQGFELPKLGGIMAEGAIEDIRGWLKHPTPAAGPVDPGSFHTDPTLDQAGPNLTAGAAASEDIDPQRRDDHRSRLTQRASEPPVQGRI